MDSARSFCGLWFLCTLVVLVYAWIDLRLHPHLWSETQLSFEPDLSQLPDLAHWGGRLLKHGAVSLLIGNAVAVAGIAALLLQGLRHLYRRARRSSSDREISVAPGPVSTSARAPQPSQIDL